MPHDGELIEAEYDAHGLDRHVLIHEAGHAMAANDESACPSRRDEPRATDHRGATRLENAAIGVSAEVDG